MHIKNTWILWTNIVVLGFIIDFFTKLWAQNFAWLPIGIFSWLELTLIFNTWIAFGIPVPFLSLLTIVLIGMLLHIGYTHMSQWARSEVIGHWLFVAWAIWNGWERVLYWRVTDFISVDHFSVFNVADICISLGAILIVGMAVWKIISK